MKINDKQKERNVYRFANLSLLKLMAILAVLGLIADWFLRSYFAS